GRRARFDQRPDLPDGRSSSPLWRMRRQRFWGHARGRGAAGDDAAQGDRSAPRAAVFAPPPATRLGCGADDASAAAASRWLAAVASRLATTTGRGQIRFAARPRRMLAAIAVVPFRPQDLPP